MPLRPILTVMSCALAPFVASAAVLIEGGSEGEPLRVVADRQQGRVLLEQGGERTLVDLATGDVYLGFGSTTPQRVHARFRPGHDAPPPYRLERFGPGPVTAGHASTYYVLFVQDQVCAEVLTSGWMKPFVDPAVRALALLDQLKAAAGPAGGEGASSAAEPCGSIPPSTLAATGWPLLAGKIDRPTFWTTSIRFDYAPAPGELALPQAFETIDLDQIKTPRAPSG